MTDFARILPAACLVVLSLTYFDGNGISGQTRGTTTLDGNRRTDGRGPDGVSTKVPTRLNVAVQDSVQ